MANLAERKQLTANNLSGPRTPSEKALALLLVSIPHLGVYFETERFEAPLHGSTKATVPDFLVVNK